MSLVGGGKGGAQNRRLSRTGMLGQGGSGSGHLSHIVEEGPVVRDNADDPILPCLARAELALPAEKGMVQAVSKL